MQKRHYYLHIICLLNVQIRDQHISWDHIRRLYKHHLTKFRPYFSYQINFTTSQPKFMKVNLAAQVNLDAILAMYAHNKYLLDM